MVSLQMIFSIEPMNLWVFSMNLVSSFKITTASTGSFRNDESVCIWQPVDNPTFLNTFSIYLRFSNSYSQSYSQATPQANFQTHRFQLTTIRPSVHPSLRLFVLPSVRPFFYRSVRRSVRFSIHPYVHPSV